MSKKTISELTVPQLRNLYKIANPKIPTRDIKKLKKSGLIKKLSKNKLSSSKITKAKKGPVKRRGLPGYLDTFGKDKLRKACKKLKITGAYKGNEVVIKKIMKKYKNIAAVKAALK